MSDFKRVILKDPVTGDYLAPKVPGTLMYEEVNGTEVAPFEFEAPPSDAATLEGHPASYFAVSDHSHDDIYAKLGHTHDGFLSKSDVMELFYSQGFKVSLTEVTTEYDLEIEPTTVQISGDVGIWYTARSMTISVSDINQTLSQGGSLTKENTFSYNSVSGCAVIITITLSGTKLKITATQRAGTNATPTSATIKTMNLALVITKT